MNHPHTSRQCLITALLALVFLAACEPRTEKSAWPPERTSAACPDTRSEQDMIDDRDEGDRGTACGRPDGSWMASQMTQGEKHE